MATGWGAVGGGAWSSNNAAPANNDDDYDEAPPQQPHHKAPAPAYNAAPAPAYNPTYASQPAAEPELGKTSFQAQPAGGFGSSSGAYGNSAAGNHSATSPALADPALRRREAELDAKEKQLKELEKKLQEGGGLQKKNWPVCYPMTYHNIVEEIPEGGARRVVRECYMAWWFLMICMMWNFFCASVMLGEDVNQKIPSWFLALLYMLLGIPGALWLWYFRLYNGAKADSTLGFVGFFTFFALHTAFCTWAAIAVPFSANQWSFAGFVTAMKALDVNTFCGIIYIVGAVLWTLEALLSFWVIKDVFFFFRGKGGVKQAKQEAAVAALKSQLATQGTSRV